MSKEDVLLFGVYGMRGTGKSYFEKLKEKDKEIERLKREKDIVIKLNHFLNYEVKRILKDDELSYIEKLQEISKVFEGADKE